MMTDSQNANNTKNYWHKSLVGLSLRCPNCEQGKTFTGLFQMNETCPVCNARFERQSGESVGGMYLNLGLAELVTIGGFFLAHLLFKPLFVPHLIVWVVINVLLVALFYRHSRSLWIAISYMTGGVQTDEDYYRENPQEKSVTSPYRDDNS
jgi:uncharacterized protein (DUF983 family)